MKTQWFVIRDDNNTGKATKVGPYYLVKQAAEEKQKLLQASDTNGRFSVCLSYEEWNEVQLFRLSLR